MLLQKILTGPLGPAIGSDNTTVPTVAFNFTPKTDTIWVHLAGSCQSVSRGTVGVAIVLNGFVPRYEAPELGNPAMAAWACADDRGGRHTLIPLLAMLTPNEGVMANLNNTIAIVPVTPEVVTDNFDIFTLLVWEGADEVPLARPVSKEGPAPSA